VIVRFADIGGIVDHHCLNFLFIIISEDFEIITFREQFSRTIYTFSSSSK